MRAVSLFSGVGGFELGMERAGIETVLQAEKDPQCLEVLARHWPGVERVADVRAVGIQPVSHPNGGGEWVEGFKPDTIHDALTASPPPKGPPLTLCTADSPVKTYQWPASGPDYPASAAVYGLSSIESCENCGQPGRSLRTFPGFSHRIADVILRSSSVDWRNSGMGGPTGFWTRATSECPNVAAESTLSDVLEAQQPPARYWLSARAAAGILRRAAKRGKELPQALRVALTALASTHPADTTRTTTT